MRSSLCSLPKGQNPLQDRCRLLWCLSLETALSLLSGSSLGHAQVPRYHFQSSVQCERTSQTVVSSLLHAFSIKRSSLWPSAVE